MTVKHRSGAGFDEPLPIRERSGRHAVTAFGHAVCMMDWAQLVEIEMERSVIAGAFTAYPNGIDQPDGYGFTAHFEAANSWMPFWVSTNEWIDPSWTPVQEWYDEAYNYDLFGLHGLVHMATPMMANRLRALDDLRRYYYDVKRMTRLRMTSATVTMTGPNPGGVNAYGINSDGSTYTYDDLTGGTVSVDYSRRFHQDVVSHELFSGSVRWVLGSFQVVGNGLSHPGDAYTRFKTVWMPVSGSAIDISQCRSTACRAVLEDEMSRHPAYAGEEYWCQFRPYRDNNSRNVVVCDVTFPSDGILVPWQWEPK